ncbi:MAG: acetyl-CoA carboxylase biotin carboxylase subunit [Anaerolineae bacterium]|jgi:acetyl-CoA carboxylase biotin carboxylase subunit|nr:acetyl-CoA carboxylase biotin carboxylase subunit [Anaerolineae bacterium]MBT6061768.1 acetyl-CoA carboxylase biotin carboxylase subunit [Anaerolineae bacterium]MBT6320895.1 acetyl-CoA carboxylase biotin carboxylase subunit [Anaerolineae bacterium]MBT6811735.1 acetyl-CoA carboxylase biotin carboxylase subunit [Anaerolineae bacterium]MBT7015877.1 acetyl-CoA carboxylase biotin carboxylase subunit [Anaerolineae bacterium]
MFTKVLIANRGEIAVRILRACRELGIKTVAVYSEADRQAMHVRYATEAYLLGPAPSSESYLKGDKIIEIALKSGAGAIHPGYGFLAERSDFAQAVEDAGLEFIGPKPSAIAAMGDKAIARETVTKAGVPVVPGTEGTGNLSDEELLTLAPEIGFPLLIKATAGGGGKGMREVTNLEEMPLLLESARRESKSAFGDDNVYLEKLILGARHIEIQVLADKFGNVIHLNERECSLQRRHQKLLEEAPSAFVDEDLRQRMGDVAVKAAEAVEYESAGTIEFLVDKDKSFYFLEMNTRLQVEHPITELVTGVDIVKEQIRIARGRKLSFSQDDIQINGAAIECRINAEDPHNNFMPSTGHISHVVLPTGPGIRVDTGVYTSSEITPYYDSMISKLIVWGETRAQAILRMRRALEEYKVVGVRTNIPFHQAMMDSHPFMGGQFDTRFVEEVFSMEEITEGKETFSEVAAIIATLVQHEQTERAAHVVRRNVRDTSNWKWLSRWERLSK